MVKAKSWVKSIKRAFRWYDDDEKKMRIHFARMCVLYEDLKLEFAGAEASSLPGLDATSTHIRQYYFLRRTFATVAEIEQAIHVLNSNQTFKALKTNIPGEGKKSWDNIVKFFALNHSFLKEWRDDTGGHFLEKATEYALETIDEDTVGSIELARRGNGVEIRMPFVAFLAMIALVRNKAPDETIEDALGRANDFLATAVEHCINAIDIVIAANILERFKS